MLIGPIFTREAVTTPRRVRHYLYRALYVATLLILVCTAWLVQTGTQISLTLGDMARFGGTLFQILAPIQLALVSFLAALVAASSVALEKDKRTLVLLLMTRLNNSELVLGKLFASLLDVTVMVVTALPLFMLIMLFGGVSLEQVLRVFAVTLVTGLAAGSLGSLIALAREKTFQSLALTALTMVIWVGAWEAIHAGVLFESFAGITAETWATACSPVRAILAASRPIYTGIGGDGIFAGGVVPFLIVGLLLAAFLNGLAIIMVRVWNPSRELRLQRDEETRSSIWGVEHDLSVEGGSNSEGAAEAARADHVDSQLRRGGQVSRSRTVWDNPILWREVRTWAYGRKVLIIKAAFLVFFAMAALAVYQAVASGQALRPGGGATALPAAAYPLAPFFVISLVIINSLAVNSITNERDGGALDLLLVTDLTAKEFVFGKLAGVLWLCREMVVLPMLLCVYLAWRGGMTWENLLYALGSLTVMNIFVSMLGIHCGMTYANSRSAIGVSLGVVFFLSLGVATLLAMMISFVGSFQTQLAPFLLFILGGGIGLFASLGVRNPSAAILAASIVLPLATFFAVTSVILRNRELSIFLVLSGAYGFTTAAMMVPAIFEFDFAMGRTKGGADE